MNFIVLKDGVSDPLPNDDSSSKKPDNEVQDTYEPPSEAEINAYEEIPINIDFACSTDTMKKEARKQLKTTSNTTDLKITTQLSEKTHLWPVYRWKCLYEESQSNSAIVSLGLDLKAYCKEARGVEFNYGYKDYLDPYSYFCTRVNNDVIKNVEESKHSPTDN